MQKIKAFTILELVIVMVISSVITTAGYFAYISSVARLNFFQYSSQQNVDLSTINTLLNKDFNDCSFASLTTPKQCILKSVQSEIVYTFDENAIYRKHQTVTDTFILNTINVAAEPLTIAPFYLATLLLTVECNGKRHVLAYSKQYDPYFLMNLQSK